jgi:AcrR family transcriptional regulator
VNRKSASTGTTGAAANRAPVASARRKNLPAARREQEIVETALEVFADQGFTAPLQDLADRIGVTQPLLHRYFPTKNHLIEKVKKELMRGHWKPEWRKDLSDRTRPLHTRIYEFYLDYLPKIYRRTWYRNFLFAAISDPSFAQHYLNQVTDDTLVVIMQEVRHQYGQPPASKIPFHDREYELVWGMHSTFAFLGQRVMIYEMPMPRDLSALVRDQVSAYLLGAEQVMRELIAPSPPPGRHSPR